jgi:hypothetical protein
MRLPDVSIGRRPRGAGFGQSVLSTSRLSRKLDRSNWIFLGVAYEQKERAKRMDARWDPASQLWYTFQSNPWATELMEMFGTISHEERDNRAAGLAKKSAAHFSGAWHKKKIGRRR